MCTHNQIFQNILFQTILTVLVILFQKISDFKICSLSFKLRRLKLFLFCPNFISRLNYGRDCSLWTLLDPFLINLMWTPLFTILTLVILSVYIKVANLAYESKRRIRNQQINMESSAIALGINKSQNKTTKSLLLVLGIFTSTYTLWLIIYYLTVNTYSETVELVQTVIDWLWQVSLVGSVYYKWLLTDYCEEKENLMLFPLPFIIVVVAITVDILFVCLFVINCNCSNA